MRLIDGRPQRFPFGRQVVKFPPEGGRDGAFRTFKMDLIQPLGKQNRFALLVFCPNDKKFPQLCNTLIQIFRVHGKDRLPIGNPFQQGLYRGFQDGL
ncbi:hypothetical protein ID852_03315 [Xenorhabdus sp. 42]|uniref:hypothetical protein n=1 Tax=Xenorhabdus szentirmaii TaxID=290112 RepID=UPI0019A12D17|nr:MULTISPECIES: hypothetical protein [unclassified Xenorhabdus]MBD2782228.1 hypothetical protein [Xenorhabdus sp. 38]MBD2819737.1 hypothetical protein [Xenorhabdus sp. 42]